MKASDPSLTELARAGFLRRYMPYKGFHVATAIPDFLNSSPPPRRRHSCSMRHARRDDSLHTKSL